jgi:hypothetical protein
MRGFQAELDPPASSEPAIVLAPELVDLITEAVAMPANAVLRAEIISELLMRVVDAVAWRHEPLGDPLEEASLMRIVDAAAGHRRRMLAAATAGHR